MHQWYNEKPPDGSPKDTHLLIFPLPLLLIHLVGGKHVFGTLAPSFNHMCNSNHTEIIIGYSPRTILVYVILQEYLKIKWQTLVDTEMGVDVVCLPFSVQLLHSRD